MFGKTSKNFRTLFLLRFTEELIRNSQDIELIRLEEIIRKRDELLGFKKVDLKTEVINKLSEKPIISKRDLKTDPFSNSPKEEFRNKRPQMRRLPVPRKLSPPTKRPLGLDLPSTVSHIKPVANSEVMIELGKLNPLINDRNVRLIEIEGENEKVFVTGPMGRKPTGIILSKEEINGVIDNFSKEAKIPKTDGMFKVVVGSLMLTAMISEAVSSRFIIKKLEENKPQPSPYRTA